MQAAKRSISSRVTIQNPRPRKYATAAERQKALRERFPTLCVRVEQEQADFMKRIADEQGRTLQDVHLAFIKYANGRGNLWLTQGLKGFAPLPRFEEPPKENPMKRKPTPAQIAARERFAEMARSGAFKKKAKRNPAKKTVSKAKRNPAPRGFVKADDYTIEVFNKYGMKPYDAVYMQTKGGRGEPIYDLTILKHENGKYLAAHGSVIVKQEFDRAGDAAAYLEEWYINNRRPAAKRNPIVLVTDRKPNKRKSNPAKPKRVKVQRPFYYVVKVGSAYDGQFLSTHYSLEDVKKIAQQKADKYGAQAKITEFHM